MIGVRPFTNRFDERAPGPSSETRRSRIGSSLFVVDTAITAGPLDFGNSRPEPPDEHDRDQGEEGFEQGAINLAPSTVTYVRADDEIEDLAGSEEEQSREEPDCEGVGD